MGSGVTTISSPEGFCPGFKNLKDNSYALKFSGLTASTASMWVTGITASVSTAAQTCALRINVNGTTYWLPVITAIA